MQDAMGRAEAASVAAVLGVDPGRHVGLAWVDHAGRLLRAEVVDLAALGAVAIPVGVVVALGDGTGSGAARAQLEVGGRAVRLVDERGTSERGRGLYWRRHPPRGWRRLVPEGMRPPPPDLDAYAAYAIALRYLAARVPEVAADRTDRPARSLGDHAEGR